PDLLKRKSRHTTPWGQVIWTGHGLLKLTQGAARQTSGPTKTRVRSRKPWPEPRFLEPASGDGKEGVDGSSPSEGVRKGQQMAFFVAPAASVRLPSLAQPVPKVRVRAPPWLEQGDRSARSTSV